MREVHIGSPIWNGDRTQTFIGIARFRVTDSLGRSHKGNIKIWVDYKIHDKASGTMMLMWKYPFVMACDKVIQYPRQVLGDRNRTILHIVPTDDLKIYKTARKRTMSQDDFNSLKMASLAVKREIEEQ